MNLVEGNFFKFTPNHEHLSVELINKAYSKLTNVSPMIFRKDDIKKKDEVVAFINYVLEKKSTFFNKYNPAKKFKKLFNLEYSLYEEAFSFSEKDFMPEPKDIQKKGMFLVGLLPQELKEDSYSLNICMDIVHEMYLLRRSKKDFPDMEDLSLAIYYKGSPEIQTSLIEIIDDKKEAV